MKKLFGILVGLCCAFDASAATNTGNRGNASLANAYRNNQRQTYYMATQLDVDTACNNKIFQCLSDYCGDVTVVPGQRTGRCQYATEGELYNAALLCLGQDTTQLLPTYSTSNSTGGMNTAARLCPSYVQQGLMSYLAMANMATDLSKAHSSVCIQRRQELEAAMSCHSIALSYGKETQNRLMTELSDFCGAGVPGGSSEMVTKFSNAGNIGSNIWGWAEKIVSLDFSDKGDNWQSAVDAVLAGYMNRMNLACGDDQQLTTPVRTTTSATTQNLQAAAALVTNATFPTTTTAATTTAPVADNVLWKEFRIGSDAHTYADAKQIVSAGIYQSVLTQNPFLTSAQMSEMQEAYRQGIKVIVLRDSARCWTIPIQVLTTTEQSVVAQQLASCTAM